MRNTPRKKDCCTAPQGEQGREEGGGEPPRDSSWRGQPAVQQRNRLVLDRKRKNIRFGNATHTRFDGVSTGEFR